MKHHFLAVAAAAGVAALSLTAVAAAPAAAAVSGPAAAAVPNSFISAPTGLHNAPSTQAPAGAMLPAGKAVYAFCFVPNGEQVQGNTTWIRISVDDQLRGWVPKAVIGGVPALPHC